MFTASEARRRTEQFQNTKFEREMKMIFDKIEYAIDNYGDSSVCIEGRISNEAIAKLKELNYGVSMGSQYNDVFYNIEW